MRPFLALLLGATLLGCSGSPTEPSRRTVDQRFVTRPGVYSWHRASMTSAYVLTTEASRLVAAQDDSILPPPPILFVWRAKEKKPFSGVLHLARVGTVVTEKAEGVSGGYWVRSDVTADLGNIQSLLEDGWSFYYVNAEWDLSLSEARERFRRDILEESVATRLERYGNLATKFQELGVR